MSILSRLFGKWRKGSCVARALYQGATWHYDYGHEVRFAVKQLKPGRDHIQCQYYDSALGEWVWSTQHGNSVDEGKEEYPHAPTVKVLTLADFLEERLEVEKKRLHT